MVQLRTTILLTADSIMTGPIPWSDLEWEEQPRRKRNKGVGISLGKTSFKALTDLHTTEVESWNTTSYRRRLLLTLGKSDTDLNTVTRKHLVSSCMSLWATAEQRWDEINQPRMNRLRL
jgi:hypothetical protein